MQTSLIQPTCNPKYSGSRIGGTWKPSNGLQVAQFSQQLQPHQMATLADGTTVLARAVIEHNLAAASRLYTNIYFSELGTLLGVPPLQAETTAARMVQEGRLQVNKLDPILCALHALRQSLSTEGIFTPALELSLSMPYLQLSSYFVRHTCVPWITWVAPQFLDN